MKGPKGDKGVIGEKGPNGDKETVGEKGPTGMKELIGDEGEQGTIGEKGNKGAKGPKADKGAVGAKGSEGQKGSKGEMGSSGILGPTGNKGVNGAKGVPGVKGPMGETGLSGLKGEHGDNGINGTTGQKGAIGDNGQKGAGGAKGNAGEPAKKVACGSGWGRFMESCYNFQLNSRKTWNEAKIDCQRKGGFLEKIEDIAENWFLKSFVSGGSVWIGAHDSTRESRFIWVSDNSSVTFTDWSTNQPDNWRNDEDCVHFQSGSNKWNDAGCLHKRGNICEKN